MGAALHLSLWSGERERRSNFKHVSEAGALLTYADTLFIIKAMWFIFDLVFVRLTNICS